jgi:hypothetical protein
VERGSTHDPAKAARLLDGIGLNRKDRDRFRLRRGNGQRLRIEITRQRRRFWPECRRARIPKGRPKEWRMAVEPLSPELRGVGGFSFEDAVAAVYLTALFTETIAPGFRTGMVRVPGRACRERHPRWVF